MAEISAIDIINKLKKGSNNVLINKLSTEIIQLKAELASIDYKTIKNTQYERLKKELPYSWEELYAESENYRIQIRQKEAEIENLLQLNKNLEGEQENSQE